MVPGLVLEVQRDALLPHVEKVEVAALLGVLPAIGKRSERPRHVTGRGPLGLDNLGALRGQHPGGERAGDSL
jgi:hypothetical protein